MKSITIGVVAKASGLRPSAVRFYERQGLVASERLANGYRAYDRQAVSVLRFIARAQALGFSLKEVREILALRRRGSKPCDCVTSMITRNLANIDRRIAELSRLRRELRALAKRPPPTQHLEVICPIIEADR
jgi:DNA-binding transcriptional MerR regulator